MPHFWLDDDQQAIMDAATGSATDYGYIGLVDVASRWKKPIRDLVGTDVADENQVRIHKVANEIVFGDRLPFVTLKSAVRLNRKQAIMLKLKVAGSGTAFLIDDPTGENWGNIRIALTDRALFDRSDWQAEEHRRYTHRASWRCFKNLTEGKPFGPTLATVGDSCKGMPTNWARAMVWSRKCETHQFLSEANPATQATLKFLATRTPRDKMVICPDILDFPAVTYGQAIARALTMDFQRYQTREKFGCDGDLGPIIE